MNERTQRAQSKILSWYVITENTITPDFLFCFVCRHISEQVHIKLNTTSFSEELLLSEAFPHLSVPKWVHMFFSCT